MPIITTTIRIDTQVRAYAKLRAQELNYTFAAYYEDLILRDLRDNKPKLFKMYKEGHPAGSMGDNPIRKRSKLADALDPHGYAIPLDGETTTRKPPEPGINKNGSDVQDDDDIQEVF